MRFLWRVCRIVAVVAATTLLLYAEYVASSTVSFASEDNVGPLILGSVGLYWIWTYAFDVTMLASLSQIPPGDENRVARFALLIVGILCYGYGTHLLLEVAPFVRTVFPFL